VLWLLEPDLYAEGAHPLTVAALEAGHAVRRWDDGWWSAGALPSQEGPVVFHGSLGNAARIAELGRWTPGAYCNTAGFSCSRWYPAAARWLVHDAFEITTVEQLVARPREVAGSLADGSGEVFVRPDSPLKPFSGRVVKLDGLTPAHLDHGFYYEDLELPIVVARTQRLGAEWRFVVAEGRVVTGCRYVADGRSGAGAEVEPAAAALAETIAGELTGPDPIYVLDLVESEAGLRMVEINAFSGADLYDCEGATVVEAVAEVVGGAA